MERTIFISSTYEDLRSHRSKVWDLLQQYKANIRGMERFGARTDSSLKTCVAECQLSDIYIGIIGMCYGCIDAESGKSYTTLEYEAAFNKRREILFFLIDEKDSKIPPIFVDVGERRDKLDSFKKLVKERHTVATFVDEEDLVANVKLSLDKLLDQNVETGQYSDKIERSSEIISKFLLMPKAYSSKSVEMKVRITGDPFPASKLVCNHFNLTYGATVGVNITIEEPPVDHFTNYLFMEQEKYEGITIKEEQTYRIKAVLKFTESVIDSFKARFVREEHLRYYVPSANTFLIDTGYQPVLIPKGREVVYEPEGTIILLLHDVMPPKK